MKKRALLAFISIATLFSVGLSSCDLSSFGDFDFGDFGGLIGGNTNTSNSGTTDTTSGENSGIVLEQNFFEKLGLPSFDINSDGYIQIGKYVTDVKMPLNDKEAMEVPKIEIQEDGYVYVNGKKTDAYISNALGQKVKIDAEFVKNKDGDYQVEVTYSLGNEKFTYNLALPVGIKNLGELQNNTFAELKEGETNNNALEVEVFYTNGKKEVIDITKYIVSGSVDFYKEGTYKIEVNYKDVKASYEIFIYGETVKEIETITLENNTIKQNSSSLSSINAKFNYTDGTYDVKPLTSDMVLYSDIDYSSAGYYTLAIDYGNYSTSYAICVEGQTNTKEVSSMKVSYEMTAGIRESDLTNKYYPIPYSYYEIDYTDGTHEQIPVTLGDIEKQLDHSSTKEQMVSVDYSYGSNKGSDSIYVMILKDISQSYAESVTGVSYAGGEYNQGRLFVKKVTDIDYNSFYVQVKQLCYQKDTKAYLNYFRKLDSKDNEYNLKTLNYGTNKVSYTIGVDEKGDSIKAEFTIFNYSYSYNYTWVDLNNQKVQIGTKDLSLNATVRNQRDYYSEQSGEWEYAYYDAINITITNDMIKNLDEIDLTKKGSKSLKLEVNGKECWTDIIVYDENNPTIRSLDLRTRYFEKVDSADKAEEICFWVEYDNGSSGYITSKDLSVTSEVDFTKAGKYQYIANVDSIYGNQRYEWNVYVYDPNNIKIATIQPDSWETPIVVYNDKGEYEIHGLRLREEYDNGSSIYRAATSADITFAASDLKTGYNALNYQITNDPCKNYYYTKFLFTTEDEIEKVKIDYVYWYEYDNKINNNGYTGIILPMGTELDLDKVKVAYYAELSIKNIGTAKTYYRVKVTKNMMNDDITKYQSGENNFEFFLPLNLKNYSIPVFYYTTVNKEYSYYTDYGCYEIVKEGMPAIRVRMNSYIEYITDDGKQVTQYNVSAEKSFALTKELLKKDVDFTKPGNVTLYFDYEGKEHAISVDLYDLSLGNIRNYYYYSSDSYKLKLGDSIEKVVDEIISNGGWIEFYNKKCGSYGENITLTKENFEYTIDTNVEGKYYITISYKGTEKKVVVDVIDPDKWYSESINISKSYSNFPQNATDDEVYGQMNNAWLSGYIYNYYKGDKYISFRLTKDMVDLSTLDTSKLGKQTVKVTYDEIVFEIEVNVYDVDIGYCKQTNYEGNFQLKYPFGTTKEQIVKDFIDNNNVREVWYTPSKGNYDVNYKFTEEMLDFKNVNFDSAGSYWYNFKTLNGSGGGNVILYTEVVYSDFKQDSTLIAIPQGTSLEDAKKCFENYSYYVHIEYKPGFTTSGYYKYNVEALEFKNVDLTKTGYQKAIYKLGDTEYEVLVYVYDPEVGYTRYVSYMGENPYVLRGTSIDDFKKEFLSKERKLYVETSVYIGSNITITEEMCDFSHVDPAKSHNDYNSYIVIKYDEFFSRNVTVYVYDKATLESVKYAGSSVYVAQNATNEDVIAALCEQYVQVNISYDPIGNRDFSEKITKDMISLDGFDSKNLGKQTVKVTYQGKDVTVDVYVYDPEVGYVTEFYAGNSVYNLLVDEMSADEVLLKVQEGTDLYAYYNTGAYKEVKWSDVTYTHNIDTKKQGSYKINVEYEGRKTNIWVYVNTSLTLQNIYVNNSKVYVPQNAKSEDVEKALLQNTYYGEYCYSPYMYWKQEELKVTKSNFDLTKIDTSKTGTQTITLTYEEKSIDINVEVCEIYNVEKACEETKALGTYNYSNDIVYVKGLVTKITNNTNNQKTIYVTDETGTKTFQYYKADVLEEVNIGDTAYAYGYLYCYNSTYEFKLYNGVNPTVFKVEHNAYSITVKETTNGTVEISKPNGASYWSGDVITVTCKPNEGYKVDKITANDKTVTKNEKDEYSFVLTANTEIVVEFISENAVKNDESFDLTVASYSIASTTQVDWKSDNVTMILSKNSASINANNYLGGTNSETRFYKGQTFRVEALKAMSKLEIETTDATYATAIANCTWTGGYASSNGTTVTVVASGSTSSFEFTSTSTVRIASVKVYFYVA